MIGRRVVPSSGAPVCPSTASKPIAAAAPAVRRASAGAHSPQPRACADRSTRMPTCRHRSR